MRVGTLYAILKLETGAFNAELAASGSKFASFYGMVVRTVRFAALVIGTALAASVLAAANFQAHMTSALAIMGGVTDDLREKLSAAARQVAKETTFSAKEAADAYYYLASAGYNAQQSLALLPVVAKFAQSGMIDLADATEKLVNVQYSFGLASADFVKNAASMAYISDVLNKAAADSNTTLLELTQSLSIGGGIAHTFGYNLEQTSAILEAFALKGIKGAKAGTYLNQLMKQLALKANTNADAFAKWGIAVYDASGNMRDMADIIGDFEKAFAGLSTQERAQALAELGMTSKSNQSLFVLLGLSGAIRKYEESLRSAAGFTETVFQKQLDAFIPQLTIMWHKITDVGIAVGNVLLPYLKNLVMTIGDWFDANEEVFVQITEKGLRTLFAFHNWIYWHVTPRLKDLMVVVYHVSDAFHYWYYKFKPILDALHSFTVDTFVKGIDTIITALQNTNPAVLALISLAGAIMLLNAALAANPVLAGILAVILLVGLLRQAWDADVGGIQEKWADFVKWFQGPEGQAVMKTLDDIATAITTGIGKAVDWFVKDVWPGMKKAWEWLSTDGVKMAGDAVQWFKEHVWDHLVDAWEWASIHVLPTLKGWLDDIGQWFKDNGPLLSNVFKHMVESFGKLVDLLVTLGAILGPVWIALQPLLEKLPLLLIPVMVALSLFNLQLLILIWILGQVQGALDYLGEKWAEAVAAFEWAKEQIKIIMTNMANWIRDRILDVKMWLDSFGDAWAGIESTIRTTIHNITQFFTDLIATVQSAINKLREFLGLQPTSTVGGPLTKPPTGLYPPAPIPAPSPTGGQYGSGAGTGFNPGFASGIRDFAGGFAMVGERGPELMYLPPHSNVYPHGTGPEMSGAPGALTLNFGGITINTGNDTSASAAKRFALMLHDEIAETMQEQSSRFGTRPRVSLG